MSQTTSPMPQNPMPFFATPIWAFDLPNGAELNEGIMQAANNAETLQDDVQKSNAGGWHSHTRLQTTAGFEPIRDAMTQLCLQAASNMAFDFQQYEMVMTSMWMNRNGKGHYNRVHVHPKAFLSGVYYVAAPDHCGTIEFYDPIMARTMTPVPTTQNTIFNGQSITMQPKAGRAILFPSWLQHSVEANQSDEERISISFNIAHGPRR